MLHLLKPDAAKRLEQFSASGFVATAEQRAAFAAASRATASGSPPDGYVVAGDVAEIAVEGVLTEQPNWMCWLLGIANTSYSGIRDAFALAAADPNVKRVSLYVNSPGGLVDGLFETLATIETFSKPVTVTAREACSAAYALAAAGGPINAVGPAAEFGSIGVACSFAFDADTEIVDLTSTEAPDKRPDPRTPEGKAVIVRGLDEVHELFVSSIARGRGTTAANVNANFGRGASMLAASAKERGMVDTIGGVSTGAKGKASSVAAPGPMTRAALERFEHPEPAPGESLTAFAARSMREVDSRAPVVEIGDLVADRACAELDAQLASEGRTRGRSRAVHSEALIIEMPTSARRPIVSSPDFDMGDRLVEIFDARKAGKLAPVFVPSTEPRKPASTESDVGDELVMLFEQRGLLKPERVAAR